MENRINWSEPQWAQHLGTTVQEMPYIRRCISDNYGVEIARNTNTGKYVGRIIEYQKSLHNFFTLTKVISTAPMEFSEPDKAREYTKNEFLAHLVIPGFKFKGGKLPAGAFQLLAIMPIQER